MSRKRFLFLVPVLVLIAGTVSAGGGQAGNSGTASNKPMVLTTMGWQSEPINAHPKMIEYWNKMFNVDIQVWNADSSNLKQQLNLRFAANEIPDYFRADLSSLRTYHEQQLLAEVPENLIRQKMPLIYQGYTETLPDWIRYGKVNGKIYLLPGKVQNSIRQPLVYRGDWVRTVGSTGTPKTLAEFEALMYRFTNNDPDRNGKKDTYGLSNTAFNVVYGAYGYIPKQWNEKNGQLVYTSIQPEMKEALGVLAKWYKDGIIDPEFITGENKGGYWALSHAFIEGRIGVSAHGLYYHWNLPNESNNRNFREMSQTNPDGANSIIYGEPVTGPSGKKGLQGEARLEVSNMFGFGIQCEKDRAKMEKIMEMQNYFWSSDMNYLTVWNGIKGEDWDYGPFNTPKLFENSGGTSGNGAGTVMLRFEGAQALRLLEPVREPFLAANNFFKDSYVNQLIVPLPSSGIYLTELTKMEDEVYIAIITGERPLSYFDQFVTQWKSNGGDILTREANEWRSSN